jgi:hypothetical protein
LSEFYSYRLIGKLTDFLQLQEFSLRRHTQVFQFHGQPSVWEARKSLNL